MLFDPIYTESLRVSWLGRWSDLRAAKFKCIQEAFKRWKSNLTASVFSSISVTISSVLVWWSDASAVGLLAEMSHFGSIWSLISLTTTWSGWVSAADSLRIPSHFSAKLPKCISVISFLPVRLCGAAAADRFVIVPFSLSSFLYR